MKKKSSFTGFLLIVVIAAGAYALYRWYGIPYFQQRTLNKALEEGCEAAITKFEEEKEEIKEDLAALLAHIDQEEDAEKPIEEVSVVAEGLK